MEKRKPYESINDNELTDDRDMGSVGDDRDFDDIIEWVEQVDPQEYSIEEFEQALREAYPVVMSEEDFSTLKERVHEYYGTWNYKAYAALFEKLQTLADTKHSEEEKIHQLVNQPFSETELAFVHERDAVLQEVTQAIELYILSHRAATGLRAVIIVGSYAKGFFTFSSDVDMMLIFDSPDGDEVYGGGDVEDGIRREILGVWKSKEHRPKSLVTNVVAEFELKRNKAPEDLGVEKDPQYPTNYIVISPDIELKRKIESSVER